MEQRMIAINARFLTQPVTGVQRYAIELSKRIKEVLREEVVFIAPRNVLHKELAERLGVVTVGKLKGHLWEQIELPLYLRRIRSPILLNLCSTAPLWYKNKIVTVHDAAFVAFPQAYSRKFLIFYQFLIPRILSGSKHIITVSEFSKQELIKYYPSILSDKISVVFNAAGEEFQKQEEIELKSEKYFLAVSSLNARKNFPLILEAFEQFSERRKDIKLYVVGGIDNQSFSMLDLDKYRSNPNVIFKGRVTDDELISYYSNTLAFLYPSFYEGFGIPPLEAQQCGTPVILSRESCFPEIFGDSALYCSALDPVDLRNKMEQILDDLTLRKKMVELGYENSKRYSWENNAVQLIEVLTMYSNR